MFYGLYGLSSSNRYFLSCYNSSFGSPGMPLFRKQSHALSAMSPAISALIGTSKPRHKRFSDRDHKKERSGAETAGSPWGQSGR